MNVLVASVIVLVSVVAAGSVGVLCLSRTPRRAAASGIGLSLFALATSAVFVGLAFTNVLVPHWDSVLIPGFVLFTCVPGAAIGGCVSLVVFSQQPSWKAGLGSLLGGIGTVVSLAAAYLLAMAGLATHPI